MFYAASEITFWILLAAIIGGGIGYGLNEAKSVRLGKRLSESRADAPMERELATAWDTIEDLNRRLQVAHETIRGGIGDAADLMDDEEDDSNSDFVTGAASPEDVEDIEDAIEGDEVDDIASADDAAEEAELVEPLVHTVEELVPADEIGEGGADGVVGTRLSDRVASASIGNQVDVVKTVEF